MTPGVLLGFLLGCPAEPDPCAHQQDEVWFEDRDRDGSGNPLVAIFTCAAGVPQGWVANPDDCDDLRPAVFPGASETCDGVDNDCDLAVDEGLPRFDYFVDADGDGFGLALSRVSACFVPPDAALVAGDCNDGDPSRHPGAPEVCDGVDNDCDTLVDDADPDLDASTGQVWYPDLDGDGFGDFDDERFACIVPANGVLDGTDCDDGNALVNPDAFEVCDNADNDCDGLFDDSDPGLLTITQSEWFTDLDGDGFGDPSTGLLACTQPWYRVLDATDCDDTDPFVSGPDTTVWLLDLDGDGVGAGTPSAPGCSPPAPGMVPALVGDDCDDSDPDNSPLLTEICDGADNDCDGAVDSDDPSLDTDTANLYVVDGDGDGYGGPPVWLCNPPGGAVPEGGDCDDTNPFVYPGQTEICNEGVDDDCNGYIDDGDPLLDTTGAAYFYEDADGDGFGDPTSGDPFCVQPADRVTNQMDCDDTRPSVGPPTPWWFDADGDGYGTGPTTGALCVRPAPGYVRVLLGEDCDDTAPTVQPGAFDACEDGIDADCDGRDPVCPRPSCLALLQEGETEDGVYAIDPGDGNGPRQVWCDQTADGGGWTLVVSSNDPVDDEAAPYSLQLSTLAPTAPMTGLWTGMRAVIPGNSDLRFSCKTELEDDAMAVDLVFYDIHWYRELTSGPDEITCFNEDDGVGYDLPPPARKNLLTGQQRAEGNHWDDGYLEGEDQCDSRDDFTVDFDDRGMDSNQYDGTDWGEDDDAVKCGVTNAGAAWFIWVR
ncbi:MAG: MopE-related protein [Myxococcota bacterium]